MFSLQVALEIGECRDLSFGVLVDPAVVDQPDRDGVEKVELFSAGPSSDDEVGLFEHTQMLHDPNAQHGWEPELVLSLITSIILCQQRIRILAERL
jgi:hypothetical protein